jgi:multidrug efflux pump subunit AcrA (membrane-fusion protein)
VKDTVVIPTAALLTAPDGSTSVFLAQGDKPVQKAVKAGIKDGDDVQISEGLAGGEKVVTVGAFELSREDPDLLAKTKITIQAPKKDEDEKGAKE